MVIRKCTKQNAKTETLYENYCASLFRYFTSDKATAAQNAAWVVNRAQHSIKHLIHRVGFNQRLKQQVPIIKLGSQFIIETNRQLKHCPKDGRRSFFWQVMLVTTSLKHKQQERIVS